MNKLETLIRALADKHLENVVAINMKNHSPLYDTMVITTAKNERIITAALAELRKMNGEPGFELNFIEGHHGGEWVLADFGDIIVHVFNEEMRGKYNLEKLWGDANRIDIGAYLS